MESLKIRTGQVNLQILDDYGNERGIFSFNPEDVANAKRFMEIQKELVDKQAEFEQRESKCKDDESKVNLLNEIVDYFEQAIDSCWGEGSSKLLFGEAKTLSMFSDFFEGIAPYYEEASKKRKAKYLKK